MERGGCTLSSASGRPLVPRRAGTTEVDDVEQEQSVAASLGGSLVGARGADVGDRPRTGSPAAAALPRPLPGCSRRLPVVPAARRPAVQRLRPAGDARRPDPLPRPARPRAGHRLDGGHPLRRGTLPAPDVPTGTDRRPSLGRQGDRADHRGGGPHPQHLPRVRQVPRPARWHPRRGSAVRGPTRDRQDLPRQGARPRRGGPVPVRVRDQLPVHVVRRDGAQDPGLLQGAAQGRPQGGRRDRLHRGDRCHRPRPRRDGLDGPGRRLGARGQLLPRRARAHHRGRADRSGVAAGRRCGQGGLRVEG
jgi:hypothetical protein